MPRWKGPSSIEREAQRRRSRQRIRRGPEPEPERPARSFFVGDGATYSVNIQTIDATWINNNFTVGTPYSTYPYQWSSSNHYFNQAEYRPEVSAEYRVTTELLELCPDPDGMLSGIYQCLEHDLRRRISELGTIEVWRQWTARVVDVRYDADIQMLRAVAEPRSHDETQAVWAGWAHDTEPLTGRVHRLPPRPTVDDLQRDREQREHERILAERRDAIWRRRNHVRDLRRRVAERRARALLEEALHGDQVVDLLSRSCFRVQGERSGRVYEIVQGYAGNVHGLDENCERVVTYCIHGPSDMPDSDHMLAQKLLLETDEEAFLRIANATPRGRPSFAAARQRVA